MYETYLTNFKMKQISFGWHGKFMWPTFLDSHKTHDRNDSYWNDWNFSHKILQSNGKCDHTFSVINHMPFTAQVIGSKPLWSNDQRSSGSPELRMGALSYQHPNSGTCWCGGQTAAVLLSSFSFSPSLPQTPPATITQTVGAISPGCPFWIHNPLPRTPLWDYRYCNLYYGGLCFRL